MPSCAAPAPLQSPPPAPVEAPALPATQFGLATWSTGKVCPDIHVKVGPARYSVPWALIGQRVQAHATATTAGDES